MTPSWGTCVPHPEPPSHLPPHPIPQSLPVHQPQASCIMHRPGLVVCFTYDNIHVSMPFSQIIPPSPSPTEYNSIFKKKRKNTLCSLVQSPSPLEKSLPFPIIPQNPMMTSLTPTTVEACSCVYKTLLVCLWLCWASVAAWASLWLWSARATVSWWRSGFTLCWLLLLWSTGSRALGLSAVVAHGLCRAHDAVSSRLPGSAVVVQGLSCCQACGIFLDQRSNLCFLHRQANSLPLNHRGSLKPVLFFIIINWRLITLQ